MPREKAASKGKKTTKATKPTKATKSKQTKLKKSASHVTSHHAAVKKRSSAHKQVTAEKITRPSKSKPSLKAHQTKTRTSSRKKPTPKLHFTDEQSIELLAIVEDIITLHRKKSEGLRSLYGIAKILDHYNQCYTTPVAKLDAIIKYGLEKNPTVVHEHCYVLVNGRDKNENELYQLLSDMANGKMAFEDAKNKMQAIFSDN